MLPKPRVIAIDDEQRHLAGLAEALNRYGAACLPIHFTGEPEHVLSCPCVRVIFADLHLVPGVSTGHSQHFSMLGGLIEDIIKPTGPYLIILWTVYPDQANSLRNFLNRLQNVTKPFAVKSLDKSRYLDGNGEVKETDALIEAVKSIIAGQPQIAALFNWEERVSDASADTVSSILELTDAAAEDANRNKEIGRLLAGFAAAAVGGEHVEKDRFRAVNEALLPILADRIASMRSQEADNELWRAAFDKSDVGHDPSLDEAAKLNRLLHIEPAANADKGDERGAVIPLPEEFSGDEFEIKFGIAQDAAAREQLSCREFVPNDDLFRWVLVQSQAACDYAQRQPGPLPFHLGLYMPERAQSRKGKPPAALWRSPCFEFEDEARFLHVSARFQISLPNEKAAEIKPLFRLREQLLNDLIYRLHGYGARPGIISFRSARNKSRK